MKGEQPAGPIHLNPASELAERVLLPGDPHRALAVAQALLEEPRMFNHHRGLWGYTGTARDGDPVTVQSTGMGGPSAAIVVEELIALGARRLVRIGTCGALSAELELGELVTATGVIAADGASRSLGAGERIIPDPALTDALAAAAHGVAGTVASTDLFYDPRKEDVDRWRAAGALAVDMEAATVLQLARVRGVRAACLLAVSDQLGGPDGRRLGGPNGRRRISREALEEAGLRLGRAALAALSGSRLKG